VNNEVKPSWRRRKFTPEEEAIYRDIQRRRDELFVRWAFRHEIDDEEYKKQHRALMLELWEELAEKDGSITFAWR